MLRDKNPRFLALYIRILSKSNMWFWIRKVPLSILWKPKMAVCSVNCKNVNSQCNKPKPDPDISYMSAIIE